MKAPKTRCKGKACRHRRRHRYMRYGFLAGYVVILLTALVTAYLGNRKKPKVIYPLPQKVAAEIIVVK